MNTNKKPTGVIIAVLAIIVIVAIILLSKKPAAVVAPVTDQSTLVNTPSAPVSETTKVSNSLSEYQNAELGFLVKYPSIWEKEETNSGVNFIVPIDKAQVSSVNNLQGVIQVLSGSCVFPPVTTIKDRGTLKVGTLSLNTISMSNTVQSRTYFNRMYSLQSGSTCYMFSFASITVTPASKGLTGSQATQAANNNKAIVNTADAAFTEVVKTFALVTGPAGTDETKASPKR